jgi:TPR repeat protein
MTAAMTAEAFAAAEPLMSAEDMYRRGLEASCGAEGEFDLVVAHKWFNLAAMQGNIEARAYRAELAKEMTQDEVAEAQRLAREYLSTHQPRRNA